MVARCPSKLSSVNDAADQSQSLGVTQQKNLRMGETGLNSERDIINRFQELKQELNALSSRFNDIDNQAQEHDSVIKALTPLDSNRKCFRLIGGVLVERTVAEVLPAVKGNGEQIRMVSQRV